MSDATNETVRRLLSEERITLGEAGVMLGTVNEPTHTSTVNRFVNRGARAAGGRRVKLEAVRVGARWVTSKQAVERFVAALTSPADTAPTPASRPAGERRRAADRAAAELARLGA